MLQKYYYRISKRPEFLLNRTSNCLKSSKMKPCWLNSHKAWREMKTPWLYRYALYLIDKDPFMPNAEECHKYQMQ